MIDVVAGDECTCDEYRARLKLCRIQLGPRISTRYFKGFHPEVPTFVTVRDPETATPAERADAIKRYEEIYGAAGAC